MSFKTKTPAMQRMLNQMAINMYGMSVSVALSKGICVCCKEYVNIDDPEYYISALCEECQDGVFSGELEKSLHELRQSHLALEESFNWMQKKLQNLESKKWWEFWK